MSSTESLLALVEARLPGRDLVARGIEAGVEVVGVPARSIVDVARFLKGDADAAYDLVDVTMIVRGERAERVLLVVLVSRAHHSRARLEVSFDADVATFPSLASVWPAAGLLEREVIDHFGVVPEGNPQPYRLLLPEVLAVDTLPEDTAVPHAAATNADLSGVPSSSLSSFDGPGGQR
jgi:NADH:ubiquinone oxidoreductase subunit C